MRKKVENYLISLPLFRDQHLHGYLMTTDGPKDMEIIADKMITIAEGLVERPLPIILTTGPLDAKHIRIVRDILREMPEAKQSLKEAKDFHFTVFIASPEADARLMEIH
jgi:hypothetical protein